MANQLERKLFAQKVKLQKQIMDLEERLLEELEDLIEPLQSRVTHLEKRLGATPQDEKKPDAGGLAAGLFDLGGLMDGIMPGQPDRPEDQLEVSQTPKQPEADEETARKQPEAAEATKIAKLQGVLPTQMKTPKFEDVVLSAELELGSALKKEEVQTEVLPSDQSKRRRSMAKHDLQQARTQVLADEATGDPVPFGESLFNLVLVTGFSDANLPELVISWFLLVMCLVLEAIFANFVLSDFSVPSFPAMLLGAQEFRNYTAHQAVHLDLSYTTLAQRVCSNSPLLITARQHGDTVNHVNSYLKLDAAPEAVTPPFLSVGPVLSMLCILMWSSSVCTMLRSLWRLAAGVASVPWSSETNYSGGTLTTVYRWRAVVYEGCIVLQFVMSFTLLLAGVRWLAGTTSVEALILNSVALAAILDIDPLVFTAMLPQKVQLAVYKLEPIMMHERKWRSLAESVSLLAICALTLLLSWTVLLGPMIQEMIEVKTALCGGRLDFVLEQNEITQRMYWITPPNATEISHIGRAVSEIAWSDRSSPSENSSFMAHEVQTMATWKNWTTETMYELSQSPLFASATFQWCCDLDLSFFSGPTMTRKVNVDFRALSAFYNLPDTSLACSKFVDHCADANARLLRYLCPLTCGCGDAYAGHPYRTQSQGCSPKCLSESLSQLGVEPCVDHRMPLHLWTSFWRAMAAEKSEPALAGLNSCKDLSVVACKGKMHTALCLGDALLQPVSLICPHFCGDHPFLTRPTSCDVSAEPDGLCADAKWLPAELSFTSCSDAAAQGFCGQEVNKQLKSVEQYFCKASCSGCTPYQKAAPKAYCPWSNSGSTVARTGTDCTADENEGAESESKADEKEGAESESKADEKEGAESDSKASENGGTDLDSKTNEKADANSPSPKGGKEGIDSDSNDDQKEVANTKTNNER